ncbi:MAG: DUF1292 domain-containing protein [Bacilli bacterium]|nr:DUF1292 domain-containing protein [Bacilli bacterium]
MEDERIIIQKDGKEVECEVIFTFESPDTGKAYIGYTDHSIGEDGKKTIYVSSYDPVLGTGRLEDLTDKREIEMVDKALKMMKDMK